MMLKYGNSALLKRLYITSVGLGMFCLISPSYSKELTAADPVVTDRELDDHGHDTSEAKTADVDADGKFVIESITFESPNRWKFLDIGGRTTVIYPNPHMYIPAEDKLTVKDKTVDFKALKLNLDDVDGKSNADYFPLLIRGELITDTGGGGGGVSKAEIKRWASTVGNGDAGLLLYINSQADNRDDIVLVSEETDDPRPYAEVKIVMHGESNETKKVRLAVESNNPGVTFESNDFNMSPGEEKIVKLYSSQKSGEWDGDEISVSFLDEQDSPLDVEDRDDLTCVKPVGITLSGKDANGTKKDDEVRFNYPENMTQSDTAWVFFKADVEPASIAWHKSKLQDMFGDQFVWTYSEIAGLDTGDSKAHDPSSRDNEKAAGIELSSGNKPKFELHDMPDANDGFGEFKLALDIYADSSASDPFESFEADPKPILYFGIVNRGHPRDGGPVTANWHFYWSQEGAGAGTAVCMHSRDDEEDNYAEWVNAITYTKPDNTQGTAFGKWDGTKIILADKIVEYIRANGAWTFTFPKQAAGADDDWLSFGINCSSEPDFVNLTYAHEATHKLLDGQLMKPDGMTPFDMSGGVGTDDEDSDGIPDPWERQIAGMETNDAHSFNDSAAFNSDDTAVDGNGKPVIGPYFEVSGGSGATRDEEFYCVLGGAITFPADGTNLNLTYHGIEPDDADEYLDWTVDGHNW